MEVYFLNTLLNSIRSRSRKNDGRNLFSTADSVADRLYTTARSISTGVEMSRGLISINTFFAASVCKTTNEVPLLSSMWGRIFSDSPEIGKGDITQAVVNGFKRTGVARGTENHIREEQTHVPVMQIYTSPTPSRGKRKPRGIESPSRRLAPEIDSTYRISRFPPTIISITHPRFLAKGRHGKPGRRRATCHTLYRDKPSTRLSDKGSR